MLEDPPLQSAEVVGRLQPEVVRQQATDLGVLRERIRLPSRAVEGEHQLSPEPLVEGVVGDRALELGDEVRVPAQGELRVDPLGEDRHAEIVETVPLGRREGLVAGVVERAAAKPRLGAPQRLGPLVVGLRPGLGAQRLNELDVELAVLEANRVGVTPCRDALVAERAAELADVALDDLPGARRCAAVPEILDERVDRQRLVRPRQHEEEERSRASVRKLDCPVVSDDLEWSEDVEPHVLFVTPLGRGATRGFPRLDRASTAHRAHRSTLRVVRGIDSEEEAMSWKAIASTAAALALVAPSWAAGAERPDDRAGPLGVGAAQALTSTGTADGSTVVRPDDRATLRGPGAVDSTVVVATPGAIAAAADGFDWTDAAIGAAGAIAVMVLAGALGVAAVRARQGGHATA